METSPSLTDLSDEVLANIFKLCQKGIPQKLRLCNHKFNNIYLENEHEFTASTDKKIVCVCSVSSDKTQVQVWRKFPYSIKTLYDPRPNLLMYILKHSTEAMFLFKDVVPKELCDADVFKLFLEKSKLRKVEVESETAENLEDFVNVFANKGIYIQWEIRNLQSLSDGLGILNKVSVLNCSTKLMPNNLLLPVLSHRNIGTLNIVTNHIPSLQTYLREWIMGKRHIFKWKLSIRNHVVDVPADRSFYRLWKGKNQKLKISLERSGLGTIVTVQTFQLHT